MNMSQDNSGVTTQIEPSSRQTVVHVLTKLSRGGAEENTLSTCVGQLKLGYRVVLVHGADCEPNLRASIAEGIEVICVSSMLHPVSPINDIRAIVEVRKLFKALRPDFVHTHQSKGGMVGRLAAAFMRPTIVIHTVHIAPFLNVGRLQKAVFIGLEHVAALFTDRFISVSEGMAEAYRHYRIGKPAIHHVVHSGMELSQFETARPPEDWRQRVRWQKPGKPFVILMVASFDARKRHLEFIHAIASLMQSNPQVLVCFAGEGENESQAKYLVDHYSLTSNFRFMGHDPRPEELIALADVCVLASEREGLPRVLVQYVAARKRVVVMDLPGISELMSGYDGASVITDSNFEKMSAVLGGICRDRLSQDCGPEQFPALDLSRWDRKTMVSRIEDVYRTAQNACRQPISATSDAGESIS